MQFIALEEMCLLHEDLEKRKEMEMKKKHRQKEVNL